MCKAQHYSLRERMNEKEVWMEQEGVGSMGSVGEPERGEGEQVPVGWEQGPTQFSIKCPWVPWKGRK